MIRQRGILALRAMARLRISQAPTGGFSFCFCGSKHGPRSAKNRSIMWKFDMAKRRATGGQRCGTRPEAQKALRIESKALSAPEAWKPPKRGLPRLRLLCMCVCYRMLSCALRSGVYTLQREETIGAKVLHLSWQDSAKHTPTPVSPTQAHIRPEICQHVSP